MSFEWKNETEGTLNGVNIKVITSDYNKHVTTPHQIIVLKPRSYFRQYLDVFSAFNQATVNIVELGIFEGGSTLLFAELFQKARIAAFDIRPESSVVQKHLFNMGFSDRVKLHYLVSQSDAKALNQGMDECFGNDLIDAVIDDASHLFDFSRASFEILFPRLRSGGLYVIEDWAWAHWATNAYDSWKGTSLSSLILELVMLLASRPELIDEILVRPGFVVIKKNRDSPRSRLDLDAHIKLKPRNWQPLHL